MVCKVGINGGFCVEEQKEHLGGLSMNAVEKNQMGFLVEGSYEVDGVVVEDGIIQENPFAKRIGDNKSILWMLDNEGMAKGKLQRAMNRWGIRGGNVDDCFDLAVEYFMRDGKDYQEGYLGEEKKGKYGVSIYVLSMLNRYIPLYYRQELRRQERDVSMSEDVDDAVQGSEVVSMDMVSYMDMDARKIGYGFDEVDEFDDLNRIFHDEMDVYTEELANLGVANLDMKKYVYYMFLEDNGYSKMSEIPEDEKQEIALKIGVPVSSLDKVTRILKKHVEDRADIFGDLFENVLAMCNGKKMGWAPEITW